MPTRFAKQLAQIVRGAVAIGMDRGEALRLAIRCARDSMPPLRLAIIDDIADHPWSTPTEVRKRLGKPRATVDRQLQALHILGVADLEEIEAMSPFGKTQAEVLPLLYLHGLSSSDFGPTLEQFLGSGAGLSAATITRLTAQWHDEAEAFNQRSLADTDYVYVWVDGIHLKVRLEAEKVCLLVMIGVRVDGTKELVALADGFRESSESWADLLRSCRRRGMRAPVLAVGDGALGFWKALREVFPDTGEQRCWFHVASNVLAALPKSAHPGAKAALAEIYNAEDNDHALKAVKAFEADYGAKWPKAIAKITERTDVLLAFYNYPAEHWIHLRTTNPIESTFATVRLRQRITKGPGSRAAGVAMASNLIESAQTRWRAVNAPHLVALVRAGAKFDKGKLIERPDESAGHQHVA